MEYAEIEDPNLRTDRRDRHEPIEALSSTDRAEPILIRLYMDI